MKKKNAFRHGDVLIQQAKIPEGAEKVGSSKERVTLALGEVTGHSHWLPAGAAVMFKYNEKTYLRVTKKKAKINHEEHGLKEIPVGDYEINIQNDYEPDGWKNVQD